MKMKRSLILLCLLFAALALAAVGFADPGKGKGTQKHGKFSATVPNRDYSRF
jgi:ABC-type oligopeptide transport system substrate-binding subunit